MLFINRFCFIILVFLFARWRNRSTDWNTADNTMIFFVIRIQKRKRQNQEDTCNAKVNRFSSERPGNLTTAQRCFNNIIVCITADILIHFTFAI